jgi:glycosyltransferase involved in cell wall biosynthesis
VKRALMVGPVPPPFGGIAAVISDIVNSDLSDEYSFDIFDRSDIPPGGFFKRNLLRAKRFWAFLKQTQPGNYDFVHIHSADPAFLGTILFTLLAKARGLKVLTHMHGTDWDDFYTKAPTIRKMYTRFGFSLPDKIVVLYRLWSENIKKLTPKADVRVIRNLIHEPPPVAPRAVEELKRKLTISSTDFVVLTVGSVGWRKGSFDIMRVAQQVIQDRSDVIFVLVGGGEKPGEMAQALRMASEPDLIDRVRVVGETPRSKIPLYLKMAHVFLLPSYIEGMPISIIEAMAHGIAVITTPVGGIPDLLTDEESGVFIPPGAPERIAEAVIRLKEDSESRNRLARAGRRVFEEQFEFSKGIEEIRELYREL